MEAPDSNESHEKLREKFHEFEREAHRWFVELTLSLQQLGERPESEVSHLIALRSGSLFRLEDALTVAQNLFSLPDSHIHKADAEKKMAALAECIRDARNQFMSGAEILADIQNAQRPTTLP